MPDVQLNAHIAIHYLGCASHSEDGLAVPTSVGPFIESLAEFVNRVTLLAYESPLGSTDLEDLTEYRIAPRFRNVELLSLGPKGTWREYFARRRRVVRRVAHTSKTWDVIVFRMVNRRAGLVLRATSCPRIVTVLGGHSLSLVSLGHPSTFRKIFSHAVLWRTERDLVRLLRASGLVFVNSEWLAEKYRHEATNVIVQPTSIRRAKFSYLAPERLQTSANVLVIGRISESKGVLEALQAFSEIKKSLDRSHLHVVGTGEALNMLREKVQELDLADDVTFHGWVPGGDQLFELYKQMDVLLSLSPVESVPRTVWEALAHSVLVVCTPVGGLPITFQQGHEVLFVPVGDIGATHQAVMRLVTDGRLRRRMIQNGFRRARESELEHVVQNLLRLSCGRWPELVGERRAASS